MMDDLRDYRFYADDMLHLSNVAIEYIWDQFSGTYFEDETKEMMQNINKIVQAKNHRPLNPESEAYKKFITSQIKQVEQLAKLYSFIDFSDDLHYFKRAL